MNDPLINIALIGTARAGEVPGSTVPAIAMAMQKIPVQSPEQQLLTQVAMEANYRRCGRLPVPGQSLPSQAPVDQRPVCSPAAADLLAQLLSSQATELIGQWLQAADVAGQRAPHALLPDLLQYGIQTPALLDRIMQIADQRGRWIATMNPDWQSAGTPANDHSTWDTGDPGQRQALFRHIRKTDPARARQLLEKSWKEETPDQRASFLAEYIINLSMDDEPFLEQALDDKRKPVRQAAADLLSQLPESGLVHRMIDRATPLLSFKSKLLRRGTLEVTLPEDLDKSALRDGIEKSPPPGTGPKQWWLQQILAAVPPSHWVAVLKHSPEDLVTAASGTDFTGVLIQGWQQAATRFADSQWVMPLVDFWSQRRGPLDHALLRVLSPEQYRSLARHLLQQSALSLRTCVDLVACGNGPMDLPMALQWISKITSLAAAGIQQDTSALYELLETGLLNLPPGVRHQIQSEWLAESPTWKYVRKPVEKILNVLEIREKIQREFVP